MEAPYDDDVLPVHAHGPRWLLRPSSGRGLMAFDDCAWLHALLDRACEDDPE